MSVLPSATPARPRSSSAFRLSGRAALILGSVMLLLLVYATDQIVPATSERQAQVRIWLAARATGIAAFVLLTVQVALGLVLGHPTNKSTWKLSKRIFPWHEHLWVFVAAFLAVHVVSLIVDPYAGVGVGGALIPGLSSYRSSAVALGTLALYAFLLTAVTARWTRLLPSGMWLTIHRLAIVVWVFTWLHGVLAGTDAMSLVGLYLAAGGAVLGAAVYRYWVSRKGRPSFDSSRQETHA